MKAKQDIVQHSLFDTYCVPGQAKLVARSKNESDPVCGPIEPSADNGFSGIDGLCELKPIILKCTRCGLRKGAKHVVFGGGNNKADIMFVGEGPGRNEDETGEPFVGRAGELLDLMLKSHNLSRDEIFITNIVKCRPPGNRLPSTQEVQMCLPNLKAQIRIIRPKIIVALGALASQTLLNPGIRVTKDRGKWFEKDGIEFLVTFHPAAVLRDERGKKQLVWEDFKSLKDKYERLCAKKDIS